eukprot:355526-Chlamydomonas_euryale.AAC.1
MGLENESGLPGSGQQGHRFALRVPSQCPRGAFKVPSGRVQGRVQGALRAPSQCPRGAFKVPSGR